MPRRKGRYVVVFMLEVELECVRKTVLEKTRLRRLRRENDLKIFLNLFVGNLTFIHKAKVEPHFILDVTI